MFGLVTRRRHEQELAAVRAEADRQRHRAETAEDRAATAEYNRSQILRQLAEADAANRRMHDRNLELGRRISQLAEADPECAAALESRLERALRGCARWMDALWVEVRHADQLQRRLDDAMGLNTAPVLNGTRWQHTRTDGGRKAAS
jgi:chromosome segregation ATPase